MKRFFKILSLILLFICSASFAQPNLSIKVNNKYVSCDVEPFIKDGTTYVPIRFIADALNVESVSWDKDSKSVTIINSGSTIVLFANQNYVYVNNIYRSLANNALLVNGRTFVPIRFVSEILGANVNWDDENYTVSISTSSSDSTSSSVSSNSGYTSADEDAVYWLSKIIEAEASGEPFSGKVAVGEVILNRVKSEDFPNTIWEVIFDNKFGIQFEPVANGSIYNTPSAESIKAAKTALDGSNYVSNCLYFLNPRIASSNWISKNRQYYTTISQHDFYV